MKKQNKQYFQPYLVIFYLKNCRSLKKVLFNVHYILDYLQLQMLYHAIIYQRLFFWLNLYMRHKLHNAENMIYLTDSSKYI